MSARITVKDLEQSARELSELSGKDFRITPSGTGSGYNLVLMRTGRGYNTVKNGMTPKDLIEWMNAYHAGIEEGKRLTFLKLPKMKVPKGLRLFVGLYTVTVDDADAMEADEDLHTFDEVKAYLDEALSIDVDTESEGCLTGLGGVEMHHDSLVEFTADQIAALNE